MPTLIQRSFAGGIVSSNVYGRSDLQKWQSGLKQCKNFIVQRPGSITNRTGTRHVCAVKDSTAVHRLIPFRYNDSTTYTLVFGPLYMRVIQNGALVYSGASPVEVVTPYASADLAQLRFVQSGNVITLVHPSYAIRKLTHTSATSWALTTETIGASIAAPVGLATSAAGTAHYYAVTAIASTTFEESVASAEVGSSSLTSNLTWTAVSGAREYNIYRRAGTGGVLGFIGTSTENKFTDASISADISTNPPENINPFGSSNNYPGAVAYYQQRRVYGGSNNNSERVWASQVSLYGNFDTHRETVSSDSVEFDLDGIGKVLHIAQLGKLIVFTENGEWLIKGDADGALTPTAINASQQSYNGIGDVPPLAVNNTLLYVQKRGGAIRDLQYDFNTDGYKGDDLTVFSTDLFEGYDFVAWAYSQKPHSVVWLVRSDGVMLGLTYLRDHQVFAWHEHETDGIIEDVCVIPSGNYDRTYVIVKRGNVRYVEYLADPFYGTDINSAWYIDCGFKYTGRNTLSQASEPTVSNAVADTPVALTLDLLSTSGTVNDIVELHAASGFTADLVKDSFNLADTVIVDVVEYTSGTVLRVRPRTNIPGSFTFSASTDYVHMSHRVTGLTALASKSCSCLLDGGVALEQTVSASGVLTLQRGYANITVGLPYESDMETLGVEVLQGETLIGKPKNILGATVLVKSSRGLFAGSDADHLSEMKPTDGSDQEAPPALVTGTVEVLFNSNWDSDGRVFIRQSDPLPLTVLSVAYFGQVGK